MNGYEKRGSFACSACGKVVGSQGGLINHARDSHGAEFGEIVRKALRDAEAVVLRATRSAKQAEARRLQERAARKVTLTTADIDEITAELRNLINMMEPYYSQGDCADSGDALIRRLDALADGRATSLNQESAIDA